MVTVLPIGRKRRRVLVTEYWFSLSPHQLQHTAQGQRTVELFFFAFYLFCLRWIPAKRPSCRSISRAQWRTRSFCIEFATPICPWALLESPWHFWPTPAKKKTVQIRNKLQNDVAIIYSFCHHLSWETDEFQSFILAPGAQRVGYRAETVFVERSSVNVLACNQQVNAGEGKCQNAIDKY